MNIEQEREISSFVSREVYYCVSSLVQVLADTAAEHGKLSDGAESEDIMQVCVQDDWDSAVEYHLQHQADKEYVKSIFSDFLPEYEYDESKSLVENKEFLIDNLRKQDLMKDVGQDCGLDPEQHEAYEHWIVSNWLAARLEEKGEMIGRDICGLTIWGRTTTGQAISMDRVIQEIYNELQGE